MCRILICKTRKPTTEELNNAYLINRDGIGIAWIENNKNCYVKGIELNELINLVNKLKLPYVIHFRSETSGGVSPAMCHPFLISPTAYNPLVYKGDLPLLFHNGVDTNVFNHIKLLKALQYLNLPEGQSDTFYIAKILSLNINKIDDIIKIYSGKFVVIKNKQIFYYGEFFEQEGILFSNGVSLHTTNTCIYKDNYKKCDVKSYHKCKYINPNCPYNYKYFRNYYGDD